MNAILPYPRFSLMQSETSSQLIVKKDEIIQTFFPSALDNDYNMPKVAVFFITTSSGNKTLILADALAFVGLRNSFDPLRELLPIIFDCSPRNCSTELIQAIRVHGKKIGDSPKLVALQIGPDDRRSHFKFFYPSYGDDPHMLLASIIRGDVQEGYIGDYRIRKILDGWIPPARNPVWQGAAFEQEDRLIRTWIHEANPNALQRAKDEAQRNIDKTTSDLKEKEEKIQKCKCEGKYQGSFKERLDQEHTDIKGKLQESRNHLAYLTAQTVNSAAHTTLQCAIRIQIDTEEKIKLLGRYVRQQIVSVIDKSLKKVPWQELQIDSKVIYNFIKQKIRVLDNKLSILVKNNDRINMTNWVHFKKEVFPKKEKWVLQKFEDFCQEEPRRQSQPLEEDSELIGRWQESLSKKLEWVTDKLGLADDQLKTIEHFGFTDNDIRIFDTHRKEMHKVLTQNGQSTYGLGLELQERYRQISLIGEAISNHTPVHLVKRVTSSGHVYFGVTKPPADPAKSSDPNDCLNEVHIPVINVPNPVRRN